MSAAVALQGSLCEAAALLRAREITATELARAALARIDAANPSLHTFITVDHDAALAAAKRADEELQAGNDRGLLHGIPLTVKDNLPTAGLRTTYNSRAYERWTPARDCGAVARLHEAGAVIVGKANLNEFGWSVPSPEDLAPPVRNPWNPAYAAVGSSSGSGAAVASGMVLAALGTDGGGSTRLPASQMGLVGLKPSRGAVPGDESAIDEISVVGVLGRTAEDTRSVYDTIADTASQPHSGSLTGLRVAIPSRQIASADLEPDVGACFGSDLEILKELGADLVEVDLPHLGTARDAAIVLLCALQHAVHSHDLRAHSHLLGHSARNYQMLGAVLSATDLVNTRRIAGLFTAELETALDGWDVLVTPVSPVVTAEAARQPGQHGKGRNAVFTAPFNLTGWPAISFPSGMGGLGLPIGLQMVTRPGGEGLLLGVAEAYGRHTGRTNLRPPA